MRRVLSKIPEAYFNSISHLQCQATMAFFICKGRKKTHNVTYFDLCWFQQNFLGLVPTWRIGSGSVQVFLMLCSYDMFAECWQVIIFPGEAASLSSLRSLNHGSLGVGFPAGAVRWERQTAMSILSSSLFLIVPRKTLEAKLIWVNGEETVGII